MHTTKIFQDIQTHQSKSDSEMIMYYMNIQIKSMVEIPHWSEIVGKVYLQSRVIR